MNGGVFRRMATLGVNGMLGYGWLYSGLDVLGQIREVCGYFTKFLWNSEHCGLGPKGEMERGVLIPKERGILAGLFSRRK